MTYIGSKVEVTLEIQTNPGKRPELLKTLDELNPVICREEGCHKVMVSQSKLQRDRIIVNKKWATSKDALHHFNSESFFVLRGAIKVLAQSAKMTISTKVKTASIVLKNITSQKEIYLWVEKTMSETET